MKKRMSKGRIFVLWLIYFTGLVVAWLFTHFQAAQEKSLDYSDPNTLISAMFFVAVFVMFLLAFRYLLSGYRLYEKISSFSDSIRSAKGSGFSEEKILSLIQKKEMIFGEKYLDAALEEFNNDLTSMHQISENDHIAIEDYVNYSLIEDVVHIPFLNQISGTLTGLGILGTFFGLSVGLNSFSLAGESTNMIESIQPLMDGIKVAFHTSIYGLIYSILYGYLYKAILEKYKLAVNDLHTTFGQFVIRISENGAESALLKYQRRITELLEKQYIEMKDLKAAEELRGASSRSDMKIVQDSLVIISSSLEKFSDDIGGKITHALVDIIVPEMNKIADNLEVFTKKTQENQLEELSRLVDAFIEKMNGALGDNLKELGNVIADTNEWQKKSLDEMQKILEKIGTFSVDLVEINRSVENAIQSVEMYSKNVERMQDSVSANLESLNVQCDSNNEAIASQSRLLQDILEQQKTVQANLAVLISEMEKKVEELGTQSNTMLEKVTEEAREFTDGLSKTVEESLETVKGSVEQNMVQVSDVVSEQGKRVSSVLEEMLEETKKQVADYLSEATALTEKEAESIKLMTADVDKAIDSTTQMVMDRTRTIMDDLSEYLKKQQMTVQEQTEKCVEEIAELATTSIKQLNDHISSVKTIDEESYRGISSAADRLASVTTDMAGKLDERLAETFMSFDKQLTDIAGHLAGVLQQMENTTTKTKSSYDSISSDIEDKFQELLEHLEQYLRYADELHHDLSAKIEQFRNMTTSEEDE